MPYATRQGTIDFPKRKLTSERRCRKTLSNAESPEKVKTPVSKPAPRSIGSSARQALHSSNEIIGRETEIQRIGDFLKTHLDNETSGSIYVSGLPGTGKTACVNHVIERNELAKKFHLIKINCTAFNSSRAVFKRICEELHLKNTGRNEKDAVSCIEKFLVKKHKIILLILDEIDQLESKSQSVLYKLFEWPSWDNSRFVLIGIANAMDLTDKNLPRLCAKIELKPILLHFVPYSKNEITEILKSRLTNVGADKLFAPGAIELISAKVAGTSGDVRRALDLGRRVIEMAEQNQVQLNSFSSARATVPVRSSPRKENQSPCKRLEAISPCRRTPRKLDLIVSEIIDGAKSPPKRKLNFAQGSPAKPLSSPQKVLKGSQAQRICLGEIELRDPKKSGETKVLRQSPRKLSRDLEPSKSVSKLDWEESGTLKPEQETLRRSPRKLQFDVKSKDVLSVVKNVFGPSKNFKPNDEESSFPLHQKLLICSLLLIIKKGKKKDINIGKLHQVYSKVCSKRGLTSVDKSGFIFLCRQVEVTGIIQLGKGQGALAKVALQWDESEVTNSLKDLNLLSAILNDGTCLS